MTNGLQSYPEYKDSGAAWLGKIPAHWEVQKLKHVTTLTSGQNIAADAIQGSGAYPVYGASGLRGYTAAYTHDGPAIIIGRQAALCGNIHYVSGKFWASEDTIVVTPRVGVNLRWLSEILGLMNLPQYAE